MSWVMVGVTAVTVVAGAYNANEQKKAGEKGAKAQENAANAATAEDRRQYDLARQDQLPFLQAGYDALARQQAAMNGDWSGFNASPDYAYARDQSLQALERGAAARGGFMGGGADADRMQMAGGLASQNFNNYWDRLRGMAGQGQGSAQNLAGYGAQMAGNIGNNLMTAAQARASSYANTANAWGNVANQAAGAFGTYMGQRGGGNWGAQGGQIGGVQRQPLQTYQPQINVGGYV
jgi:hypothetical protein